MDNVNSVCFVGKIEQINGIQGADKIVQAIISQWECVIQKDKYKVGNLVVIATTDAVIPFELAEKLGVTNYLKNRKKSGQYTVKTTKLKGVYSSAMIVDFPIWNEKIRKEGVDCMDIYKIYKYEEPAVQIQLASGKKIRYQKNPNFHIYHKFPNAKNAPNIFNSEDEIVITRKIHGCNARYGIVKKSKLSFWDRIKKLFGNKWIDYDFVYGSHEVEKGSDSQGFYSTDVWREVGDNIKIKDRLWHYVKKVDKDYIKEGIILYGELYGPGIQKYYNYNRENLGIQFFDIKVAGQYLDEIDLDLCLYNLGLPKVEVLYTGKFDEEQIKKYQLDNFIEKSKVPHEGVVCKHINGDRNKICKYINPEYLEFQSKKEDSTDFH